MKISQYLVFLIFVFNFFTSCSKESNEIIEEIKPQTSVNITSISFGAESESTIIEVTSNTTWTIKGTATWCKSSLSSSKGNAKVTISVDANPTEKERILSLLLSTNGLSDIVINISQKGSEPVVVNPDYIVPDKTGMSNDAINLAKLMKLGWNVGNSLEACGSETVASETMWGNPKVSKKLIESVKSAGFNVVRIPCAWSGYIEDASTYKIQDAWLSRVKEVVDYCVDNDMYVVLNIHWDGGWLENNPTYDKQESVNKKQAALWKQIAIYFRDYDEHLLFAGTNEVHKDYNKPSTENLTVQMSFNQTFVNTVRATGGRNAWRNLVVQAYNTNIEYAISFLKMPTDATTNRMMTEVHFYDPYDFTLQEDGTFKTQWGKSFVGGDVSSWGQESWVDEVFGNLKTHFVDKGMPIIIGEYGAVLRTSIAEDLKTKHVEARNYYLNYVTKAAKDNGLIPIYWDNGNVGDKGFGLFNRSTGEKVHTGAIDALVSAVK